MMISFCGDNPDNLSFRLNYLFVSQSSRVYPNINAVPPTRSPRQSNPPRCQRSPDARFDSGIIGVVEINMMDILTCIRLL